MVNPVPGVPRGHVLETVGSALEPEHVNDGVPVKEQERVHHVSVLIEAGIFP